MLRWLRKRKDTLKNCIIITLLTLLLLTLYDNPLDWGHLLNRYQSSVENESEPRLYFETEHSYRLRLLVQDKLRYGSHIKRVGEQYFNPREGYNESLLDALPILRDNIPDFRPASCVNNSYHSNQPSDTTVSVIINYHNELLSLLLRSVYSVLVAIPRNNLHEVILIDDASNLTAHHELLEVEPLLATLDVDIKFYRWEENKGLIYSRRWGAQHATGRAVLILDSHVEVKPGFIEPLLAIVDRHYKTVAAPVFDFWETFDHRDKYINHDGLALGFDRYLNWKFVYHPKDGQNFPTPAILGGAFLASKRFLEEIDYFGRGMVGWGYENIEVGLKTWMCGGVVHYVPCSRVLHYAAQRVPLTHGDRAKAEHLLYNAGIVVKSYFSEEQFQEYDMITNVNLSMRSSVESVAANKAMLKRNKCTRDYEWIRSNLMPRIESYGKETSVAHMLMTEGRCVTVQLKDHEGNKNHQDNMFLESCSTPKTAGNMLRLTRWGELRIFDRRCLDWGFETVTFVLCHWGGGNQITRYNKNTGQVSNMWSTHCLGRAEGDTSIRKVPCKRDRHHSQESFTVGNFQFRTIFNFTMLVGGLELFDTPHAV